MTRFDITFKNKWHFKKTNSLNSQLTIVWSWWMGWVGSEWGVGWLVGSVWIVSLSLIFHLSHKASIIIRYCIGHNHSPAIRQQDWVGSLGGVATPLLPSLVLTILHLIVVGVGGWGRGLFIVVIFRGMWWWRVLWLGWWVLRLQGRVLWFECLVLWWRVL